MAGRKTNVNLPSTQTRPLRFMLSTLVVGFVVVGGAILLGRSDTGQIDVAATIIDAQLEANNKNSDGASGVSEIATPSQAMHATMPNGGLVSTNAAPAAPAADVLPEPVEEAASTTATSTQESEVDTEREETPGATETTAEPAPTTPQ